MTETMGSEFKDRTGGLIAFGILQILLGAFCALMVPLMVFSMSMAGRVDGSAPQSLAMVLPALAVYVLLAVWFIGMGIGSIRAMRWARALLLVTSSLWLLTGAMGLVMMVFMLPAMSEQMGESGTLPEAAIRVMQVVMLGFMGLFYVVIPGGLVLFYRSKHVKATCEQRHPQSCWTDNCPLPILALSLMAGAWAAFLPCMGFYGWALPFFGSIASGALGAGIAAVSAVLLGYVAWGAYHLKIGAWWCALVMVVMYGASAVITFTKVSMVDFYAKMNFPEAQLALMQEHALAQMPIMVVSIAVWTVLLLAYLLYIKRYFGGAGLAVSAKTP